MTERVVLSVSQYLNALRVSVSDRLFGGWSWPSSDNTSILGHKNQWIKGQAKIKMSQLGLK